MASSDEYLEPLNGLRVLDLADEKASYCSKLLADLGAEVVKMEQPGGERSRLAGPFVQGQPHTGASLSFWYNNAGKRGLTLDLESETDRATIRQMVRGCDVVVESFTPGYLDGLGLGYKGLSAINPGLVMASVTGYGQTGPYSKYKSCDLTASASGGQMYLNGRPDRAPLKPCGNQSYYLGSLFAANGILLALHWRDRSGKGQYIDISLQEAVAAALEHVLVRYFHDDVIPCRQGALQWNCSSDIFPCRDKFVLCTFNREWDTLLELLNSQCMAADLTHPAWSDEEFRKTHIENIQEIMSFWTCTQDSKGVFELGQSMRFPWGIVNSIEAVAKNEQLRARGFFLTARHPAAPKEFKVPGPVIKFDDAPVYKWRPAPSAGEHDAEQFFTTSPNKTANTQPKEKVDRPLDGIKILDFTWMLAGPYATRLLADFGAEVIKVQSRKVATGAERNDTGYFAAWNRNKLGITLDLSNIEARGLVLDLVKKCDAVIENFTTRVMENWGFTYEKLKEVNPQLVMVSLSGFGHMGPWRDYAALGPSLQALSGITELTSYDDGRPYGIGLAYADHVSGLYAALAALSALRRRDMTGKGAFVELSEYEAACSLLGPELMGFSLNGKGTKPAGNGAGWQQAAPHGCYRCRGEDRWLTIAVFSDEEWSAMRKVMGDPDWTQQDRFNTMQGRRENPEELDSLIAGWTAKHPPQKLAHMLQEAGVPAAAVSDADDLAKDPQLEDRGFFIELKHPALGKVRADANPIRMSGSPAQYTKAAPLLGEDNRRIFVDFLGMDECRFKDYVDRGIIA